MVKRKRIVRKVKHTVLIVGEGVYDYAFLKHLQKLYDRSTGRKITVKAGDGGSPADVIHCASKRKDIAYDEKWVLIDADIALSPAAFQLAKKCKVGILQSEPWCLEGMLLEIIGEKPPLDNAQCKKRLHPKLAGNPAHSQSYEMLFPKTLLEASNNPTIQQLIILFRGASQ